MFYNLGWHKKIDILLPNKTDFLILADLGLQKDCVSTGGLITDF